MKIGIIDADLIGKKKHRFPNLCCMKISNYYKKQGCNVELLSSYDNFNLYDKVFIAKVFTDTPIDNKILELDNVEYGGTGFFYDKAKPLPDEIEHCFPDYHLYDKWVNKCIEQGKKRTEFVYYLDYSIGFLTRGCFRQCEFCVNKNKKQCVVASPLQEFIDNDRPKICLQDDNFFACSQWKKLLNDLKSSGKRFQFKQGLDERLLNQEKIEDLFSCKTEGDLIFAFDNIEDAELIESKLHLIRTLFPNNKNTIKFYTFVGFDRNNIWDDSFWKQDIFDCFKRIKLLINYKCIPYITRFNRCDESPHRGMYVDLARWCNQPSFFKKKSFREFCEANGKNSACYKYMIEFEKQYPDIAPYFDMKFSRIK